VTLLFPLPLLLVGTARAVEGFEEAPCFLVDLAFGGMVAEGKRSLVERGDRRLLAAIMVGRWR